MKKMSLLFLILATSIALPAQSIINALTSGPQNGTGILMGSEAGFSMNWEWTLNDQFLKLTFQNSRKSKEGEPIAFQAHGYYKVLNDSALVGNWFDSRGVTFPLTGTITDTALTIVWGTPETEQGKTIYKVDKKGVVSVMDFFLSENEYRKFGEATYGTE